MRSATGSTTAARATIVVALAGLLAAGCADGPTSAAADASTVGPSYLGPIPTVVDYPRFGVTLRPPTTIKTGVSWWLAYADCKTDAGVCGPGDDATIALALATTTGTGTARTDGTIRPLVDNQLAFAIVFNDTSCHPSGGPEQPNTTTPPGGQRCTIVDLIDARNGEVLFSAEGRNP
jgi:hypothetical protein